MSQCKVSVILPVYNVEQYLGQCLDSLVNQTLKDIEIICVDDGSTDSSLQILNDYAAKDGRIHVCTQKNAGAGAARNRGISLSQGEYLSFLDSDDFFDTEMLEKAYAAAVAENAPLVVFRSDQYYEDKQEYKPVKWTLRREALPPYRPINYRNFTDNVFKVFVGWAWDKLFKREFVIEHNLRFQEQRTSNDLLFVFSAVVLADRIAILEDVLAHQRRQVSSSLSNTRDKSWDCFYHALVALKNNLVSYGLYRELEQDFLNYVVHFSLWHLETIQGQKKQVLYDKLRQEWFAEFGVTEHKADYFYNKKEYAKYSKIMSCDYEAYFA